VQGGDVARRVAVEGTNISQRAALDRADAVALRRARAALLDDPALTGVYSMYTHMPTMTQIAKWGNSLGLRLPKSVALEAQLDEGDRVDVSVSDGAIVIRPARPRYSLTQLVARITPRNRHDESNWGPPAGREVW
jgi:antitoxin MazE